ncbi:4Fe-4S dicluster domain-containing protein [Desulfallas thermosapovorans]|uniref:Carbon-monoxide dehydrogenase iron sulfur subunit n=1 Tax=Desulfallas thermosapovorans DSM 6562 TaxID=1121431 RepID=A0A5S4ZNF2_9FIRM|nr:4Fe-4S dicluster domain-containing protein [Desulfallas thermosapovorans]TYO93882.1 carbon-monoxide dehydrogenase iron sulfur subunit [Desulfallas thermosapovorans DSM 6562]
MEVLVNMERCLGCRSCELACAVAHSESKTLLGALGEDIKPLKRIFVHQVGEKKIPLNCRHCQEAPCIDACITGAMHRTPEGVVTNEGGAAPCNGCWMCVMVCPYGVIRSRAAGRVAVKCDRGCLDVNGIPACVRACPTKALEFTVADDFSRRRRQQYLQTVL